MKLKELIAKMNGVKSYGLYFVDANTNTSKLEVLKEPIVPNCTIQDVVKYLSYDVYEFNLSIFDDDKNNKYIRACIYLYIDDYLNIDINEDDEEFD